MLHNIRGKCEEQPQPWEFPLDNVKSLYCFLSTYGDNVGRKVLPKNLIEAKENFISKLHPIVCLGVMI